MFKIIASVLLAICAALSIGSAALAVDGEGTYSFKQKASNYDGNGEIKYTLKLKSDKSAEMTIERTGHIEINDRNTRDYGNLISYFSTNGKLVQRGTWRLRDDIMKVKFTSFDQEDTPNDSYSLAGDYSKNKIEFDDYNEDFYGKSTQFKFTKASGNSSGALIAAAAVIGIAALASSNSHSSNSHDRYSNNYYDKHPDYIRDLNVNLNGTGNFRFYGGNNVSRARLNLYRGGRFDINIGDYNQQWNFTGSWNQFRDDNINLTIDNGLGSDRASGSGSIRLRNRREVSNFSLNGKTREGRESFSLYFTAFKR